MADIGSCWTVSYSAFPQPEWLKSDLDLFCCVNELSLARSLALSVHEQCHAAATPTTTTETCQTINIHQQIARVNFNIYDQKEIRQHINTTDLCLDENQRRKKEKRRKTKENHANNLLHNSLAVYAFNYVCVHLNKLF